MTAPKTKYELSHILASLDIAVHGKGGENRPEIAHIRPSMWTKKNGEIGVCIAHICVVPELRGLGFASMLLTAFLHIVDRFKLDCCVDPQGDMGMTQLQKITWYERYGFVLDKSEDTWVRLHSSSTNLKELIYYRDRYAEIVERCRKTPGKCFCGVHISYIQCAKG